MMDAMVGNDAEPKRMPSSFALQYLETNRPQIGQNAEQYTLERQEQRADRTRISLIYPFIWEGDSAFDAWLTTSAAQIAQVLLTLPSSFAQLGLASGIALQVLYGFMGCWTTYVTTVLYADYRRIKESQGITFHNHTIQWYEVLRGLLGPRWMVLGLFFNTAHMSFAAAIQIIASGSIAFHINDHHSKRTWTLIFGAIFLLTALIPTAHNYRLWSFMGILMTTYTAWYLTIAAVTHGQVQDVKHTGPNKLDNYFIGATNILYAFGGHGFTLEIMHAMWKPKKYKVVYLNAVLYVFTLTIPSASAMYWTFGDDLLNNANAFFFLPKTKFLNAAAVAMLIHEFIQFIFLSLPVHIILEKTLGLHHSRHFFIKAIARMPIVLLLWLIALMLPFFGPINSAVGSLVVTGAVYIIPCLAHMTYYWDVTTQENAIEQPPLWIRSWRLMLFIDICVIFWVTIVGVGFGGWASIKMFISQVHKFGIFESCFDCSNKRLI
ncbi:hypothetical protein O6H91_01G084900 [Diphasiastrum complanatum]|uniref:Uncharacterized protein n=1 Tax=Diphasiastrum complanatum TaxID=34168 RepID=A0ACC2ET11_DIPCM|nr:hypothetical protein O6H91_Y321900 [Diphasiastrum complanatum]KAJ7569587.1 hypothetical protein O6H91_01G084900 [Diphasiastrum complanatum]